jgi:putative nucleotidyltransferase with HDIG domain
MVKYSYSTKFVWAAIIATIIVEIILFYHPFAPQAIDIKLILNSMLLIFLGIVDIKVTENFRTTFLFTLMFYILIMYPLEFAIWYVYILLLLINIIRKLYSKKRILDSIIVTLYISSFLLLYAFSGVIAFKLIYKGSIYALNANVIFSIFIAFIVMETLTSLMFIISNKYFFEIDIKKKHLLLVLYSFLGDFISMVLFLMFFLLFLENLIAIQILYVLFIFIVIFLFNFVLKERLDISKYTDLINDLNSRNYNIDDFDSINHSISRLFARIKFDLNVENIYYFRETDDTTLEIGLKDDIEIYKYVIPLLKELKHKRTKIIDIAKEELPHYNYHTLFIPYWKDNIILGGLVYSTNLNTISSNCKLSINLINNRINSIINLYLKKEERKHLLINIVSLLVTSIEDNNYGVASHSQRVAKIARSLGNKLGYDREKLDLIEYAGLLHDIGIVSYSRDIFSRKSQSELSDEEWNIIKKHPQIGYNILKNIKSLGNMPRWILDHHERWDGMGFPNNKKGNEISEESMLLNIANVIDSFIFGKSYINPVPLKIAEKYILKGAGTLFDPKLIKKLSPYLEDIMKPLIKGE